MGSVPGALLPANPKEWGGVTSCAQLGHPQILDSPSYLLGKRGAVAEKGAQMAVLFCRWEGSQQVGGPQPDLLCL